MDAYALPNDLNIESAGDEAGFHLSSVAKPTTIQLVDEDGVVVGEAEGIHIQTYAD